MSKFEIFASYFAGGFDSVERERRIVREEQVS
jgi:hypothetical protein